MSKSKRNTVDPDDIIATYGADTARWFMLSDSPPERDVIWTEEGVQGAGRFVQRVWRLVNEVAALPDPSAPSAPDHPVRRAAHRTLAAVEENIEGLRFNVAVARIYELTNAVQSELQSARLSDAGPDATSALREATELLVQMIAPMMPHLAEECWQALKGRGIRAHGLVAEAPWPKVDRSLLVENTVTLPVQVNGKKRADVTVPRDADQAAIEAAVLSLEAVRRATEGRPVKKIIVVPQRIVNVVA
jgi:leucyl-tRNA synthetase